MKLPTNPRVIRIAAWAGVAAASLAVLMLYTPPDFMVMLADQLWACF